MNPSQIVLIGFGAVGKAFTNIMLNIGTSIAKLPIIIIDPKDISNSETFKLLQQRSVPVQHVKEKITEQNYINIFNRFVKNKSIVVEVAYRISTLALIIECRKRQCVYVNTAIDSWKHTMDTIMSIKQNILNNVENKQINPTTVLNHGMNPGIVSHLVKYLLRKLAGRHANNTRLIQYCNENKYNYVAMELGLTLVQISERDAQQSNLQTDENIFYNTWSVIGLLDEATCRAEVSWGTHERKMPSDADTTAMASTCQIILPLHGCQLKTISYEPTCGKLAGYCIPHAECYSLANYLQIKNSEQVVYRPSIYYSYLVPNNAKLIANYMDYCLDNDGLPKNEHVLRSDEILGGFDSVGCLAYFKNGKRYWIGSVMDNSMALKISPEINVTCMQVGISLLACVEWMINNPNKGICEPEDLDSGFVLNRCKDWLGKLYCKDVTNECNIQSDQFSDLIVSPNNVKFI